MKSSGRGWRYTGNINNLMSSGGSVLKERVKEGQLSQCHDVDFLRWYAMEKGAGSGGKWSADFSCFRIDGIAK